MYPFVWIIITNWNEKELLKECLTSIKDHTDYPNFRVIVDDNCSTDGSVEMVRRNFPWVKLIENKMNVSFAKANNQGIKHALKEGADYIFLLNNDTKVIHDDWLTRMVEIAEANPNVGLVGCKLVYPDGRIQRAGGLIGVIETTHYGAGKRDNGAYDEIKDVDYVWGAAFMIKRELVQKIGLLDEGFSPAYFEDLDYCVRAKMAGYRVIYNTRTTIMHYLGATIKKRPQLRRNFIWQKNKLRFILLYYPVKWIILKLPKVVIGSVVEKKDEARKLSPLNARLRKEWYPNLTTFLKAYLENFKLLKETLQRRKNRTSKVWY